MQPADFVAWAQSFTRILFLPEGSLPPEREWRSRCRLSGYRWGCVVFLFCVAEAIASPAQTFTTLASFDGTNGALPFNVSLAQGLDGNLYGTTNAGGINGAGTVFKITPGGTLETIYSFCAQSGCADGLRPVVGVILATNGRFYGTASLGGLSNDNCRRYTGCGTLFQISPQGKLTTLHSFALTDGLDPSGGLVQATNGNFYGSTFLGGTHSLGTIFQITSGGTLSTLHNFCDKTKCADGSNPAGTLLQAVDGNFYGITADGGANNCFPTFTGCGTVFKLTPQGTLTTLYSFCAQTNCTDGNQPSAGLVQATNGNFYGTTFSGGANNNCVGGALTRCGTVFKITTGGMLTTLYSFCAESGCADGATPDAGLVQATDGNFYGTAAEGGANGAGTVFKITPAGKLTTLYSFCTLSNCPDGNSPVGGLVQATDGSFYGTTFQGGTNNLGTVFKLSVGLAPFVKTLPTSAKVGAKVKILGTNLTGATSVSFNGSAATFAVVSSSEIATTVPSNATTGKVKVTTPGGTLSSNVVFRVSP